MKYFRNIFRNSFLYYKIIGPFIDRRLRNKVRYADGIRYYYWDFVYIDESTGVEHKTYHDTTSKTRLEDLHDEIKRAFKKNPKYIKAIVMMNYRTYFCDSSLFDFPELACTWGTWRTVNEEIYVIRREDIR